MNPDDTYTPRGCTRHLQFNIPVRCARIWHAAAPRFYRVSRRRNTSAGMASLGSDAGGVRLTLCLGWPATTIRHCGVPVEFDQESGHF